MNPLADALAAELRRPDAPGPAAIRAELAALLSRSEELRQAWPLLSATLRAIVLNPAEPAAALLCTVAALANADPWRERAAPAGWELGQRRAPARIGEWSRTPERIRRERLQRVARLAQELAEALAECPGADDLAETVAGLEPNEPIPLFHAERFAQGEELPRRLRDLAAAAAGRAKNPGTPTVPKPNRDGARRSWWMRRVSIYLLPEAPTRRAGLSEADRLRLIAAVSDAILNVSEETIGDETVRKSLKRKG